MLSFLKNLGIFALGLLFIALIAWLVFPSSQKAADSVVETNPVKKKSLGEIFVRDFLGIPRCGLLGGGCSDTFPSTSSSTTMQPVFSHPDIKIVLPNSGATIMSGFDIEGVARTSWFSQGIASGEIRNEKYEKIGAFTIKTQSTLSNNSFVSFTGKLVYGDPSTKTGYVVFKKVNVTTDTTKDASVWVPVRFQETTSLGNNFLTPPRFKECRKTGCSGQVCSDSDVITTCEFRPEYACFQNARCERQQNGECGFTQTTELTSCITQTTNGLQNGQLVQ